MFSEAINVVHELHATDGRSACLPQDRAETFSELKKGFLRDIFDLFVIYTWTKDSFFHVRPIVASDI